MNDKVTWTVISIPTVAWAKKIFPEQAAQQAVQSLWDEIIKMVRVDQEDMIDAWDAHNDLLEEAYKRLNDKQYIALRIKASGTDLEVGLTENHILKGAEDVT